MNIQRLRGLFAQRADTAPSLYALARSSVLSFLFLSPCPPVVLNSTIGSPPAPKPAYQDLGATSHRRTFRCRYLQIEPIYVHT